MKILKLILTFTVGSLLFSQDTFQKGIDAYHDSEYETAIEAFEQAAAREETAAAQHNLALALYQAGKVGRAAWHLERAHLLDPGNESYYYKLGALRQQLGLFNTSPKWYELASKALSPQGWIILLVTCLWITLAAFLLPVMNGSRTSLPIKAVRALGLIGLVLASVALYLNRGLLSQGIVLANSPSALHAAPASAAPQTGLARPGERGIVVDQHGEYVEIETEGGASGWIHKNLFRKIL